MNATFAPLFRRLWNSPTVTTWSSLATRLASIALVLPLVLVKFSTPEIAVWQLFNVISTLQLLADFGFSPTFTRLVAYARGGATLGNLHDIARQKKFNTTGVRDEESLRAIFNTMRVLYTRIAWGSFLIFGVTGTIALIRPMSHVSDSTTLWIAWAVMVPTTSFGFWAGAFATLLGGLNHVALLRRWETGFAAGQILSAFLVLTLGGNLLMLAIANQAWVVANAIRIRLLVQRLEADLCPPRVKPTLDHTILAVGWPAAWRSGVGVLLSYGIVQSSGLIYSQVADAANVASYLLALRAINVISQFSQAPLYSKLPELAHLYALNDRDQLLLKARNGMRLSLWIMVIGVIAVLVIAVPLLSIIHSKVHFVPTTLWMLIALAFFIERFGAMHLQLYSLTNHIVWHTAASVTGAIMLGAAWVLFPRLNVYAMPVAMLAGHLSFYTWYSVVHSYRAFHMRFWRFESRSSLPQFFCLLAIFVASIAVVGFH